MRPSVPSDAAKDESAEANNALALVVGPSASAAAEIGATGETTPPEKVPATPAIAVVEKKKAPSRWWGGSAVTS